MVEYEFTCRHCDNTWTEDRSFGHNEPYGCPACRSADTYCRVDAGTGFILKGGDWSAAAKQLSGKGQ